MGIPVDQPEKQMGQAYVKGLTKDLKVSDAEARAFYDSNKEMVGGMAFEQVRGSIEPFLLQQKREDAVHVHIADLGKRARLRLNRDWVKKQAELAFDNPVDRARRSGKPTMAEFGATGVLFILLFAVGHCIPIVVAGSSTAAVKRVMESSRLQGAGNWFRKGAGVVIAALGVYFVVNPFVVP